MPSQPETFLLLSLAFGFASSKKWADFGLDTQRAGKAKDRRCVAIPRVGVSYHVHMWVLHGAGGSAGPQSPFTSVFGYACSIVLRDLVLILIQLHSSRSTLRCVNLRST